MMAVEDHGGGPSVVWMACHRNGGNPGQLVADPWAAVPRHGRPEADSPKPLEAAFIQSFPNYSW